VADIGDVEIIEMDWYYSHRAKVEDLASLELKSSFDIAEIEQNLVDLMEKGTTVVPQYSYRLSRRSKRVKRVNYHAVIIVEGLYALSLRDFLESHKFTVISVFMECAKAVLLDRRLRRDLRRTGQSEIEIMDQFENLVYPAYLRYIKQQEKHADMIILNSKVMSKHALVKRIQKEVKALKART
jgi:uridine kinase